MKDRLFGLLEPVVDGLGYELVDIDWGSAGSRSVVRVFIDRTDGGSVGLDDCERVSRAVGAVLEAEDPIGSSRRRTRSGTSTRWKSRRPVSTGRFGPRRISPGSPAAKRGSNSRGRWRAAAGSAAGSARSRTAR